MPDRFANTPEPPYYAVIFANRLKQAHEGYEAMGEAMAELALKQPGCLGAESCRDASLFGITVSYWADEKSLLAWKANAEHLVAQRLGIEKWYEHYELRVARIERAYSGPEGRG
ncbi:antibiotic biosynthesis monooxygenase [uncultured Cohaesibacter sp.]|uniref:antibiotic biosynthesis monooxygenase family protein n=1 Tax=uncultured Cohaesibacter sp. TaxID=1002546 RepID=UPI0029C93063|nr:antibiotic biosynthesis monooxygenase [uncultured Cohaesibacter sp.]